VAAQHPGETMSKLSSYTREVEPGVVFLRETAGTSDLVILLAGVLGVYKDAERVATIDTPGTYVGEIGALLGGGRTASVRAETKARIVWVPADKVESFFEASPELALKLARTLARRLRDTTVALAAARQRNTRLEAHLTGLGHELGALRDSAGEIDTPARLRLHVQRRIDALLRSLPEETPGTDDLAL
jgi:CRP-like cAMP-binding protein